MIKTTIMIAVPRIFEKIYSKIMAQIEEGNIFERNVFKWAVQVAQNYFAKIDRDLSPSASDLIEFKLSQYD